MPTWKLKRRIIAFFLFIGLLLPHLPPIVQAETQSETLRFLWRTPRRTSTKIVLALIDSETLKNWTEPIAAYGAHYAELINQARKNGAELVAFDIIPAVPVDDYLLTVVQTTLHGLHISPQQAAQAENIMLKQSRLQPDTAFSLAQEANAAHVVLSTDRMNHLLTLMRSTRIPIPIGITSLPPQTDIAVRQMPYSLDKQPTFAWVIEQRLRSLRSFHSFQRNSIQPIQSVMPTTSEFTINYISPQPRRTFTTIPAWRFEPGKLRPQDKLALENAIVLVGMDYPGSNDTHLVASGAEYPGVEIQAHALATLQDHAALVRLPRLEETLLAFGFAVFAVFLILRISFKWGVFVVLITVCAWVGTAQILFTNQFLLLPLAAPILALLLSFGGGHLAQAIQERQRRKEIERIFGSYITPTIRDYLLQTPQHLQLGGKEGEGTALILDLRNFAAYSNQHAAAEVMATLNELFALAVPLIQEQNGILLSYTGDGFLAVFGPPLGQSDHAERAIAAASAIARAASCHPTVSAWTIGCSLHSGSLAFGNLGTQERPEFTVIGTPVNLAARLQEVCKEWKATIVLTAACLEAAGYAQTGRSEAILVRGFPDPVVVYELKLSD